MATLKNTTINLTTFSLPSGTTAQRPASPAAGSMRYNTTLAIPECSTGPTVWIKQTNLLDGSTVNNAAPSGYYIAQNFPDKASGYYWIKSPRMPNALQMYVDMTTEGGGFDFYAITGGTSIGSYSPTAHSGATLGLDLVYPRSSLHWQAMSSFVYNVLGNTGGDYFQTKYAIYRTLSTNAGNYSNVIMRDPNFYGTGANDWKVPDGGRWWLRNTVYGEPNGDYTALNFLSGGLPAYPYTGGDLTFNDVTPQTYVTGSTYLVSTNAKP